MNVEEIYKIYNLPIIKKEGITEIEYNHRCKYLRLYIRLIDKCKSLTKEDLSKVYYETHHILPRCLGGKDNKTNLVNMPVRYHIMAHIVILESYPESIGLIKAASLILGGNNSSEAKMIIERNEAITKYFSSRTVSRTREKYVAYLKSDEYKKSILGENNPNYGNHMSEKSKESISKANKGRVFSEETKALWSKQRTGKVMSEETKKKISESNKGRKLSEETKKKLSDAAKKKFEENPDEYRKKMSERAKKLVITPELRKTRSEISRKLSEDPEYRKKISDAHKKKLLDPEYKKLLISRVSKPGGKNSRARKIVSPTGEVYDCILDAARAYSLNAYTLSSWAAGKTKDNHGWSFYKEDEN